MYRLIIVDDEQIVLDGLKFLIEDTLDDIEVVATSSSGREAIAACEQYYPDIVLMDIKMPGINGIEAIEAIKKRHIDIRFVIISAYEQFEYAKQAVELGVSDYILKPINPDKVTEVLNKIKNEILVERNQRLREIKNREKLEKIIPVLEHGFIYSLLLNTDYRDELNKYHDLFEVKNEKGYVMIIEFGEGKHSDLQNKIGTGIKGQSFYPKVQSAIKYKCKCIVGPMIVNQITVLIYENHTESEYEQRIKAFELADSIYNAIKLLVDSNIYIGIGSCYALDKTKNSLEEAMFSLNRITDEHIVHINDISEKDNSSDDYTYIDIKEDETHIIKLLELGDEEQLVNEMKTFFNKINKKFHGDMINVRNTILELMVMVLSCSYRNDLQEEIVGYSSYLNDLNRLETIVSLQNWCLRKVSYISEKVQSKKGKHISRIVLNAKNYIDEHLREELSLIDISKEVSVSPQYFSKIFKDEIGLSFVEYVRKKRIDIAKEMLRTNKYSVKEICYQIGYNDPNYFSRLFKKLVGVSPTEYK